MAGAATTLTLVGVITAAATVLAAPNCDATGTFTSWCAIDRIGNETRANNYTDHGQLRPAVAALVGSATMDYVVTWQSELQDGSAEGVYAAVFEGTTGRVKVPEFLVNTGTTNLSQSRPAVAGTSDGGFVIVWQSLHAAPSTNDEGVFSKLYRASGAVARATSYVNTLRLHGQTDPAVAASDAGGFMVVWTSAFQDGSLEGVYARVHGTNGAPTTAEIRVNQFVSGSQRHPAVAALSGGRGYVVAWESHGQNTHTSGSSLIFARVFDVSGNALSGEIAVDAAPSGGNSAYPAVAGIQHAEYSFVVAWERTSGSAAATGEHLHARVFNAQYAATNTTEIDVATTRTGSQRAATVAALPDGDFIVGWQSEHEASEEGVYAQLFHLHHAGQRKQLGETQLNAETLHGQTRPRLAVIGQDANATYLMAAWQSDFQDGSVKGVYKQRLRYGLPTQPATCDEEVISYYGAEPSNCVVMSNCRANLCRCILGRSAAEPSGNHSDWRCMANSTATAQALKSLRCDAQRQCFTAYRQCVEVAAYIVGAPDATGIGTECRTWGRLLREATRQASTPGWFAGSTLRQSCAATACQMYSQAPTRCSFIVDGGPDDTVNAVCTAPPPIAEIAAAAATTAAPGGGSGSGPGAGGTPAPASGGTPTPPRAPTGPSTSPASTARWHLAAAASVAVGALLLILA
eukprot:CAMPEP_0174840444 /NCGR_PEP_ID=MMETSP1114-20130205/8686_1 /TAXON_ID=312471 /ORGANISM="Neobodo designis, Strain CCAP 1951/1" /LENGTH=686 /DNA_ID=CAMNT_0016074591 /DNA_START=93 /DNA_END=2153 /DNA_ORIENTATION=+